MRAALKLLETARCRQLGPTLQTRLLVHRHRVLPHGALAPAGGGRDLLVPASLEQEKRNLPLGGRELPGVELLVHRSPQPFQCQPSRPFRLP